MRFIAFGLIFLWHADMWSFDFFPRGNGAANSVAFFIILSGVVSGYSSFHKSINCSLKNIVGYLFKKIKKVYPLYLVTTLFTISYSGLAICIVNYSFLDAIPQLIQLLKNIFLIQSWFPENYFSYNGVGWFLSTIMFLYLLNLPLLYLAERIKKSKYAIFSFVLIFIGIGIITVLYCYAMRNANVEFWTYVFPLSRVGEYAMGICLANIVRLLKDKINNNQGICLIFTVLEIATLAFWCFSMSSPMQAWEFRIVHWIIPNVLLLFVFTIGKGYVSTIFRLKPLIKLGDISFECFLVHQIIIHEYSINTGVNIISKGGKIFSIAFCLALTILIAELIHKSQVKE